MPKHTCPLRLLILLSCLLAACGGGGGGGASSASSFPAPAVAATPTPIVTLKGKISNDLTLSSTKTGAAYPIFVYLPADYGATSDALPALYVLDAEGKVDADGSNRFQRMAELVEAEGLRVVLVGVGNYARRGTDYLLPGASAFYGFLSSELIPAMDARYRLDAKRRGLAGHSYGGVMTLLALLLDRPQARYFSSFIAQDGSFGNQNDKTLALEQQLFTASGGKLPDTALILSSSAIGNNAVVQDIYETLQRRNYQGLSLQRLPAYPENHDGMFLPSFRDSLRALYGTK